MLLISTGNIVAELFILYFWTICLLRSYILVSSILSIRCMNLFITNFNNQPRYAGYRDLLAETCQNSDHHWATKVSSPSTIQTLIDAARNGKTTWKQLAVIKQRKWCSQSSIFPILKKRANQNFHDNEIITPENQLMNFFRFNEIMKPSWRKLWG